MTEPSSPNTGPSESDEARLARALGRPPLSDVALARMRVAVEEAWRNEVASRRRLPRWAVATAASIAVAAGVIGWLAKPGFTRESVAVVAGVLPGSLVLERPWRGDVPLAAGESIAVGATIRAGATSMLTVTGGGRLLIKVGTRFVADDAHEIQLQRGAVYVDLDPSLPHGRLRVRTPLGVVQHLGTQFEVAVLPPTVRVRVREGAVQVLGSVVSRARAGEEIELGMDGVRQRRTISAHDAGWDWVRTPIAMELENRSVMSFLRWVARETGCRLQFADEQSRLLAERTILHGSIGRMPIDAALRSVLATTSLKVDLGDGEILVHRTGAETPRSL